MRRAVLGLASVWLAAAAPALAQLPPEAVTLIEGEAPAGYVALGEIAAEHHQTSLFPKKPAREALNDDLRAQAAKLGADAVIRIDYTFHSALASKKGQHATGLAVKLAPAVAATAAPSSPAPSASTAPPPVVSAPMTATPATASPPAPQTLAEAAPVPASPVAAAPVVAAPVPAAPAAIPSAAPVAPGALILSEGDLPGRPYETLGEIKVEARQTSLFPKTSPRKMLDDNLRAQAQALGADAVIRIVYDFNNPLLSNKGQHATGLAVKFR